MSRRRGQHGYIERSGRWHVVRVWVDVPGQEEKSHKSFRICPIQGPGALNKSERRRKADEIIANLGINSEERFDTIVNQASARIVTFREQGEAKLNEMRTRRRNPAAERSIGNLESVLRLHLNPILGDMPVGEIYHQQLKLVVHALASEGKATSSIINIVTMAKEVVASAVDPKTGEPLYPRAWKAELIDLPILDRDQQNTPCFAREILTALAAHKEPRLRHLFMLLGASGVRISEGLGIEIDKHISPDFLTITIRQQADGRKVSNRVKKPASKREIDLHPDIAARLRAFVGDRKSGFLFSTRKGTALGHTYVLANLHRSLQDLGYINTKTGNGKAGNHAFRRARNTYLRNETACPEGIYKFWMGHAIGKDMSDLYDKVKRDLKLRRYWAEHCGYGFDLPQAVLVVPSSELRDEAA